MVLGDLCPLLKRVSSVFYYFLQPLVETVLYLTLIWIAKCVLHVILITIIKMVTIAGRKYLKNFFTDSFQIKKYMIANFNNASSFIRQIFSSQNLSTFHLLWFSKLTSSKAWHIVGFSTKSILKVCCWVKFLSKHDLKVVNPNLSLFI